MGMAAELSKPLQRKLVLAGVLLCTLRASLSIRPYVYPDDGVCAIIMFNSLFIPEGSTLAPPYKSDFAHFMDAASHHSKTEYGFGIDHRAYPVDLFVAIGYTAYSDYGKKDCRIVPPILHSTQLLEPALLDNAYPVRLVRVISALKNLKKDWSNTTALAVSLGMGGRWYVPAFPDRDTDVPGNYSLGHRCKTASRGDAPPRDQISSIAEGCEDPRYNKTFSFESTFESLFAYDKSDHMLFTYDSAFSYQLKLCDTKKNVTDLHYNIVADDIQFDDIDDFCGYGKYSRLLMLKKLAAFLEKNYTTPDQGTTCKLVT
ncbi:hypothetical protein MRX96_055017 [Rhipicephalus microplus]